MSRTVCEDCERVVSHYFCEHCGSVRLAVVDEPQAEAPAPKPESPFARALRHHRGDLTGAELVAVIRRYNAGRRRGGGQADTEKGT